MDAERVRFHPGWRLAAHAASALAGLGLVALCAGCAFSYVDSSNVRHVIGFVDVSLPAEPGGGSGPTPTVVSVTSIGMHVYSGTPNGSGVVLGYGKETVLTMPNNSCVDLSAPGVCETAARATDSSSDRAPQP